MNTKQSEDMRAKCKAFDKNVNKVLGKAYNPDDFMTISAQPHVLMYMFCPYVISTPLPVT
jgi:hypothetical protein